MTAARVTEYLPLDTIQPAQRNAKRHDLDEIKASLRRFGFVDQAVIDERTGRLVAGHGRTEALAALHAEGGEPPSGVQVRKDGMWLVPVTRGWRSKDDSEAHALGIALNRLTERGGWDRGELADLLESFAVADDGLAGLGWSTDELDDLLAELEPAPEPADRAAAPEPEPERQVQGLREVSLMFSQDDHREFTELLAVLRRQWREDAAPAVVLRAMRDARGS